MIQHTCQPCGRNFVDERLNEARYAVHVGVARFDRLSDATTAHWLADICPAEHLTADDLDLKTRFLTSALQPSPSSLRPFLYAWFADPSGLLNATLYAWWDPQSQAEQMSLKLLKG